MKPKEEILEISRRRYERAGIIADWKPDPICVGSQDILEWLDAQADGATVSERAPLNDHKPAEYYLGNAATQPESSGGGEGEDELSEEQFARTMIQRADEAAGQKSPAQFWENLSGQSQAFWKAAARFALDREHRLKEKLAAAETSYKAYLEVMSDIRDRMYDALECDGHRMWEDDILQRAIQVMRQKREAEERAEKAEAERDDWNREANEALDSLRTRAANAETDGAHFRAKYYELLMSVGNVYPGETRHETAKRYIRSAENRNNPAAEAKP